MDSVVDYARQWAKREKEDLDTLSEWVKSVKSLKQIRIKKTQWVYEHSRILLFQPTRPLIILLLYVNNITYTA